MQQQVGCNVDAIDCAKTATTAFSILLFTETGQPGGFFLKKKPPCTLLQG
jgi:hypothetical protein